jgi:GNAT superfamily N-acetyltransferase
MISLVQRQFINRLRQYGLSATICQINKYLFRSLYKTHTDYIIILPSFSGKFLPHNEKIRSISYVLVEDAFSRGTIPLATAELLLSFLNEGSKGVCAVIDNELAGYAWIQESGIYHFGKAGIFTIPPGYAILKNLYVLPKYRGRKLGLSLNRHRLSIIAPQYTPIGFVIPDAFIKQWCWFNRKWHIRIKTLCNHDNLQAIIAAIDLNPYA